MGNTFTGNKKTTKIMKIDGETMKLRTPLKAGDVLKDYPGLVLLESEAVKHYGVRAKALEADMDLEPKRLYFLVELPKGIAPPRRIRSGINMSAKDRLESLKLARRSASDLSIIKKQSNEENGEVRLKMRIPKAEVEKLIRESKDEAEAAQRIMGLCLIESESEGNGERRKMMEQQLHRTSRVGDSTKPREKKVSFMPITQGGREIAVAS